MKAIRYKYLLVALIAFMASGCKKFLEKTPDLRTQLNSKEKVAQLLVSAYPKAEYLSFTENASDNAEDKGPRTDYIQVNSEQSWTKAYFWEDFENGVDISGSTDDYWNKTYLAIAAANTALQYIDKHPEQADLRPYRGEALLARAYAHFMLVSLYANIYKPGEANNSPGIPFVTDPEITVSPQYKRGTVAEVYNKIERDLTEGLLLIDNSVYKTAQKYHFSQNSANAFAARFYLFKGDFAKVIAHTGKVLTSGEQAKSMLRPWNSTYAPMIATAMEVVFTKSSQNSNLLMGEAESAWARNFYIRYGLGKIITNSVLFGPNISGGEYAYKATPYVEPLWTTCKFNELFFETTIGSGFGDPYIMVPLFTADELIMNRAEAYASTNQFDLALQDINTFLSTRITGYSVAANGVTLTKIADYYGIADPKAGVIKTILDLKRAEFVTEGLRWFDILRHDLTVKHNKLDANENSTTIELKPGDPRRVFQLPIPALKAGLALNPR
ncbi:RagB/SusD family nutrient uptake outer membrane protein [Pedobacter nyackensis]|uniref:RagB/SusD family nutrient uptake outer membrane protein n=1 Tax=Pedobacter nyackensis TaxID=475255 RepID=UPI00292CE7D9|nr:RagB/SusD family nutrient uptake outer membrane protein [Pedobacter nyackensis]